MILLLLINLLLGVTVTIWVAGLFHPKTISGFLLSWCTLFTSLIFITEILLGLVGALGFYNLLAVHAALFLLSIVYARRKRARLSYANISKIDLGGFIKDKPLLLISSLLIGFILVKSFLVLQRPPFGWDPLIDHLAFPAYWIHKKTIINPMVVFGEPAPSYYPISSELFYLWFMLPLSSSFIADLGQVFFFILAGLAAYGICKRLNMSNTVSLCAGIVFMFMPSMFRQISMPMNDVMMPAYFLTAVYFILALRGDTNIKNLILCGLASGVFFGIKTSSIFYIAFLVLFLPIVLRGRLPFKKIVWYVVLFFILVIAIGGYKYIQNFILAGNPLYPAKVKLFGTAIFKGVEDFSGDVFKLKNDVDFENYLFHQQLGVQLVLFTVIGTFFSLPLYILKNRQRAIDAGVCYLLVLPLLIFLTFYFAIPFRCPRYLFIFIALGCISFFYILNTLKVSAKLIKIVALISVLISIAEISKYGELISSLSLSLLLFLGLYYKRGELARVIKNAKTVIIIFVTFFISLLFIEQDYIKNSYDRYIIGYHWEKLGIEGWKWINDNTNGNRIAYTGIGAFYPLYGVKLKNTVEYISINDKKPYLHSYADGSYLFDGDSQKFFKSLQEEGNYRENPDYVSWYKNLKENKIEYLYVSDLYFSKKFPIEDEWANSHSDIFKLVFSNPQVHIYEVHYGNEKR